MADEQIALVAATFGALTLSDIEDMTLPEISAWYRRAFMVRDVR